jgi:hypothetical protein
MRDECWNWIYPESCGLNPVSAPKTQVSLASGCIEVHLAFMWSGSPEPLGAKRHAFIASHQESELPLLRSAAR